MRISLCIISIIFFFSSCQLHEADIIATKSRPFIQLVNGTVIHTYKVEWNYGGFQKEFVVNGRIYPTHDVAFYSDGKNSFANVHKKHFAEMVSEGKINAYKTQHIHFIAGKKTGYGAGPYLRHNSILDQYYVQNMQQQPARALVTLNYNHLEPLIPGDAVAYGHLLQYRNQRNMSTATAGVGIAAIITGTILMNIKGGKKNYSGIGLGTLGGGVGLTVVSLAIKIPYRLQLLRVVKFYN